MAVSAAALTHPPTAVPPLKPPQNSNLQNHKIKLKMQKNRLFMRFFCKIWSECGDSNPGPPAPKAGALPTAQHPDMKLWDCPGVSSQSRRATNCATPRYEIVELPGRILPKQEHSAPNDFRNIKKQGGPDRLVGPPRSESEKGHKKLPESAALQC